MSRTIFILAVCASACGPTIDLRAALKVEGVTTGWLDARAADGTTKLVPAVSFTVKNISRQPLTTLQINAVFRRVGDDAEWGSGYLSAAQSGGLPPAGASKTLFLKSQTGYTGTEPRDVLLRNSQFVDARVDVYARNGALRWARLGEYRIDRRIFRADR